MILFAFVPLVGTQAGQSLGLSPQMSAEEGRFLPMCSTEASTSALVVHSWAESKWGQARAKGGLQTALQGSCWVGVRCLSGMDMGSPTPAQEHVVTIETAQGIGWDTQHV